MSSSLYLILTSIIFPVLAICWLCCIGCCIYKSLMKSLKRPGRSTKVQIVVTDQRDKDANSNCTEVNSNSLAAAVPGRSNQSNNNNVNANGSTSGNNRVVHFHSPIFQTKTVVDMATSPRMPPLSQNNQNNHSMVNATPPGIPDVEEREEPLNQSYSSGRLSTSFSSARLNHSLGSVSLSEAIKEARRTGKKLQDINRGENMPVKRGPLYYPTVPHNEMTDSSNAMAPLQAPWPRLPPLDDKDARRSSTSALPTSVRSFLDAQSRRH